MSKFLTENFNFRAHIPTFRAENTVKRGSFKAKNNDWKFLKQLQNNFEKVQKTSFLAPKIVKNDPSKRQKRAIFLPIIVIFGVICKPLPVLKIHPKVDHLRSKTMLKHFLNNSKNNFEKVQKTTFWTPKIVRNDPSKRSKWENFWMKVQFSGSFINLSSWNYTQK